MRLLPSDTLISAKISPPDAYSIQPKQQLDWHPERR